MGNAPRPEFRIGGRAFAINPEATSTKAIRSLKSEEFDPTMRAHRAELFYRTKFRDHYDDHLRHLGHYLGSFRPEFVEWTRQWPAAVRARWAWRNRDYIDGALWTDFMADPAFAAAVDALQNNNVAMDPGYLPSEYAKVSPLFVYNDEFLNAAYNPVPFLAVLKLKSLKPDEKTDWIGTAAADSLVSKLSSIPGMFVAERERVASVVHEKAPAEPNAVDPEVAAKVGKSLDVEQVVVGSYVADGDEVLFNLRIVDVQTGAVEKGMSRTVSREHLLSEMPTLATSLADVLGFTQSGADIHVVAPADANGAQTPVSQPRPAGESLGAAPGARGASASQQRWAAQLYRPVTTTNSLKMKLTLIPPGEFTMGSPKWELSWGDKHSDDERQHRVRITKPFYMGIYHVTLGNFLAFYRASGYKTEAETDGEGGHGYDSLGHWGKKTKYTFRNWGKIQSDDCPVVNVSWYDATEFCKWLSKKEEKTYRLPTEAEWEYACRAGTTTAFYFGDSLSSPRANFKGDEPYGDAPKGRTVDRTTPVGSYAPNAFGLYDMHGNAWQWCHDWYNKDYYFNSPTDDPQGPSGGAGSLRVFRGGGWRASGVDCRSARRGSGNPSDCYDIGFRVVREP